MAGASLGKVEVMFAQQREDPLVETFVARMIANNMRRGRDTTISVVADQLPRVRALLIASAGCTALSLAALECLERVDIVDMNPAQLRLVSLKAWLIYSGMNTEDQVGFLGLCDASPYNAQWRLNQWDSLKAHISKHAEYFTNAKEEAGTGILEEGLQLIPYWENRKSHIAFGVARVGVYEEIFRKMSADAQSKGIPNPVSQTHQILGEKHRVAWDQVFASTFDRTKLAEAFGPAAVNFSMSEEFSTHFSRQFRKAASSSFNGSVAPSSNYFWRSLWADGYGCSSCEFPYAFAVQLADKLCDDNSKLITAIAIGQYLESECGLKVTPTQARNVLTHILSSSIGGVEIDEKATCTPDEFVGG